MSQDSAVAVKPPGLIDQIQGLENRFWIVNVMEMFERLAYYGVRAVVAIYMVLPLEYGGPEFTHVQKGSIFAAWASVQSVLPVFTGGFADRYGHKRTIAVAILIKIVGYIMMAQFMDYWGFFSGCMMLAAGTAIFKPGVQGTLAATLKRSDASVGWALFYQLVNIGGFLGPVVAGVLRLMDWKYVFYSCAVIVAVNYLWLPFYKDPSQDEGGDTLAKQTHAMALLSRSVSRGLATCWAGAWVVGLVAASWHWSVKHHAGEVTNEWLYFIWAAVFSFALIVYVPRKAAYDEGRGDAFSVFIVSVAGLFQHRVIWFCLLFAGFWMMFNQVFDLLPNVIDDWVDTSGIIASLGEAYSSPLPPTILAIFLGCVLGFTCAVTIFLAMRPDHRDAAAVPEAAYCVVAIALAGAAVFPVKLWYGTELVAGSLTPMALTIGMMGGGLAYLLRIPGRPLAMAVGGITAIAGCLSIRTMLIDSAPGMIELAEQGAQVPPEWMINANPALIVFTMVGFGYLTSFVRPLTSILLGMVIATVGSVIAGTAAIGWICIGGILVFSVGEMLASPKKMEFLATLAKKGQEGTFMGYANMPVAIGWIAGSLYAGTKYEKSGDKVNLARKHLEEALSVPTEAIEALSKSEVVPMLAEKLQMTPLEVQSFLFEQYEPWRIWIDIGLIGLASVVGMVAYSVILGRVDRRSADSAAGSDTTPPAGSP
jgi:dipeptide/tripeptide permease